ncbi:class I tRNA ligase family protein [Metamycoplasma hominis]|uniref:class I tRNA ligase family protein n=1 Tax=Metamycoplasma hominis TaxID=2098 RepID=UPI0023AA8A25|nr:class I tRNA ligase family protein [Metamycoplasma hominis]
MPIEHKMLLEAKKNAKDFSVIELRKKAAEYALSQVEHQKAQFKKLSLFTDFSEIYVTLDKNLEFKQLELFAKMVKEGLIYRDLKPVYWSPSSQSALAEAEVEYADHVSPSLYVAFKVIEGNKYVENGDYLIIWTTTPWTLLANSGVAINDQFEYAKVLVNGNKYIIAKDLVESVAAVAKWEEYQVLSTFKGKEF